jgi:hypothetical protein
MTQSRSNRLLTDQQLNEDRVMVVLNAVRQREADASAWRYWVDRCAPLYGWQAGVQIQNVMRAPLVDLPRAPSDADP